MSMTVTAGGVALQAATAPAARAATTSTTATSPVTRTTTASSKAVRAARQQAKAGKAVAAAKDQLGDPYRYGGTGPGSFDCSGLVQYAWRKAGVKIPRVTHSQYARIRTKVSWANLRPGDLMFFHGKGHVGMYVGNGKMIHSPSSGKRVRIEKLSGWRKSSFAGAVRPGL